MLIYILLAYLKMQNINISKSDFYFSISVYNTAEKYHKSFIQINFLRVLSPIYTLLINVIFRRLLLLLLSLSFPNHKTSNHVELYEAIEYT